MILNQYYLDCLSQASYLIGDETTGRAVVVDPRRDISEYLFEAEELGLTIELVIETHFHADFLSGHLELAKATGAKIVYSSVAQTEFESMGVADGQRYSLGDVTLEFRHTPGHTPESLSIVIYEHADDTSPTACSPATPCSSVTSAGPTCWPRSASPVPSWPPNFTTHCTTS